MANSPDDKPLQELKHDAVPGYLKAFIIAFAVMGLYLAFILISSPGSAKEYDSHDKPAGEGKANPEHRTDGT